MSINDKFFANFTISTNPNYKNSLKHWLIWLCWRPFEIIRYPLGKILGQIIIPARGLEQEKQKNLPLQGQDILKHTFLTDRISSNGQYKSKLVRFKTFQQDNARALFIKNLHNITAYNQRKLIIVFLGNDLLTGYDFNVETAINFSPADVIVVEHPVGPHNVETSIRIGLAAIQRALELGYKPTHIGFVGYSIGGGISGQVLTYAANFLKENEKFAYYANIVSFADLYLTARNKISAPEPLVNDLQEIIKTYQAARFSYLNITIAWILWLAEWEMNTLKAIKSGLKVEKIDIAYSINDPTIGNKACLAAAVEEEKLITPNTSNNLSNVSNISLGMIKHEINYSYIAKLLSGLEKFLSSNKSLSN